MLPSLLQIKATKIAKLDKTLTVECLETKMCNETTAILLWVMLRKCFKYASKNSSYFLRLKLIAYLFELKVC